MGIYFILKNLKIIIDLVKNIKYEQKVKEEIFV